MVSGYWQLASIIIIFVTFGAFPEEVFADERVCNQNERFCISSIRDNLKRLDRAAVSDFSRSDRFRKVDRQNDDDFRRRVNVEGRNEIRRFRITEEPARINREVEERRRYRLDRIENNNRLRDFPSLRNQNIRLDRLREERLSRDSQRNGAVVNGDLQRRRQVELRADTFRSRDLTREVRNVEEEKRNSQRNGAVVDGDLQRRRQLELRTDTSRSRDLTREVRNVEEENRNSQRNGVVVDGDLQRRRQLELRADRFRSRDLTREVRNVEEEKRNSRRNGVVVDGDFQRRKQLELRTDTSRSRDLTREVRNVEDKRNSQRNDAVVDGDLQRRRQLELKTDTSRSRDLTREVRSVEEEEERRSLILSTRIRNFSSRNQNVRLDRLREERLSGNSQRNGVTTTDDLRRNRQLESRADTSRNRDLTREIRSEQDNRRSIILSIRRNSPNNRISSRQDERRERAVRLESRSVSNEDPSRIRETRRESREFDDARLNRRTESVRRETRFERTDRRERQISSNIDSERRLEDSRNNRVETEREGNRREIRNERAVPDERAIRDERVVRDERAIRDERIVRNDRTIQEDERTVRDEIRQRDNNRFHQESENVRRERQEARRISANRDRESKNLRQFETTDNREELIRNTNREVQRSDRRERQISSVRIQITEKSNRIEADELSSRRQNRNRISAEAERDTRHRLNSNLERNQRIRESGENIRSRRDSIEISANENRIPEHRDSNERRIRIEDSNRRVDDEGRSLRRISSEERANRRTYEQHNHQENRRNLQDSEIRTTFGRVISRINVGLIRDSRDFMRTIPASAQKESNNLKPIIPSIQILQAILIGFLVLKAISQHESWSKKFRLYSDVQMLRGVSNHAKVF